MCFFAGLVLALVSCNMPACVVSTSSHFFWRAIPSQKHSEPAKKTNMSGPLTLNTCLTAATTVGVAAIALTML